MSEQIKILLVKRKMTVTTLAEKLGISQSNLSNKLKRDNFSVNELKQIAKVLNCELICEFKILDITDKE